MCVLYAAVACAAGGPVSIGAAVGAGLGACIGARVGKCVRGTSGGGDDAPRAKLRPISAPGDGHKLNRGHEAELAKGKPVLFAGGGGMGASGGRGTAVCEVAAPPKVVWGILLDFKSYGGRLPSCKFAKVYHSSGMRTRRVKVHMKLDAVVKAFDCYYDHTYDPQKNMLTWTLDADKTSDFTDVQGQWYVEKHPSRKDCSRVWYSADVSLPPWLPSMVVSKLMSSAGKKSCAFIKTYSEKQWARESRGSLFARMKPAAKGAAPTPATSE